MFATSCSDLDTVVSYKNILSSDIKFNYFVFLPHGALRNGSKVIPRLFKTKCCDC